MRAELPSDLLRPDLRAPAGRSARVVSRAQFEAELVQRCGGSLMRSPGDFALLLVRLRRSDRRARLLDSDAAAPLLRAAQQAIAAALNEDDQVAACTADEIAVLLPRMTQPGIVLLAAERIFRALAAVVAGPTLRPQIGAAIAAPGALRVETLLQAVDVACDAAAHATSRIVFADEQMLGADEDELLPALQHALDINALTVVYQPQYDLRAGEWTGMEALIRWPRDIQETPVSPRMLVDLAERHGLMDMMTTFVLNTSLRQLGQFKRDGVPLSLAVNLSPSMLADAMLPQRVAQALLTWDVAPSRLVLEVTENSIVQDAETATQVMIEIAGLGASWSIDDFGTGHSSLARLRDMPLAELKIDRMFVSAMAERPEDVKIVRSVIDLAQNFGLRAVAEGVEDRATLAMLHAMGCEVVQGYFCARPMSAEELARWWPQRSQPISSAG